MSDEPESADVKVSESAGPLAGERLAAARRELDITVLDVAKELHLDEPKVRALERNDFEVLGAPVFAKGHLRKYAQLVGVSIEDVLADYYSLNRATTAPPLVARVRKPARGVSPGPWTAVIVILIAAAAAYWYFVMRQPAEPAQPSTSIETPIQQAAEPQDSPATTSAPVEDMPAVLLDEEPAEAVATAPAPIPDGTVRLTIRFTGDCWTEITDAAGDRLFFASGTEGRIVTVEGAEPLNVLFGKAENVVMDVNGVRRPFTAADRRGDTARLTITSP